MMPEGAVSPRVMRRLQKAVLAAPSARSLAIFHMGGGRIRAINSTATAFPHRRSQFVLQVKAIWDDNTAAEASANMAWVKSLKKWLAPLATGSYVNYMDPFLS